jgi:hypothetical protein
MILTAGLLIIVIAAGCTSQAVREPGSTGPVILVWAKNAQVLKHLTHIAKGVWTGDPLKNKTKNIMNHQDTWMERGVVPLVWAGGVCYLDERLDDFVERWRVKIRSGARALQIDEYMPQSPVATDKMVKALKIIREEYPNVYLAVWHGSFLTEPLARAYAQYVDLVILENYFTDQFYGWLLFSINTQRARKLGIINKTIFGLKITEESWKTQEHYLEEQMKWIRRNAPEMNGIGFFAPKADQEALQGAETLAVRYFNAS